MKDSVGDPRFSVWLIADSEPKHWQGLLLTPLDPRHPARHSIWTSVLDYMQETLYRQEKRRFASDQVYITNAIKNQDSKPVAMAPVWPAGIQENIRSLGADLSHYRPKVVLTFGAFAFEFVRRACGEEASFPFGHWTTKRLGEQFKKRVRTYDSARFNVLPLLHVSISRGRFLEGHRYFVGEEGKEPANYFEFAGSELAILLLRYCDKLPIWVSEAGENR